jgi:hypothetical protein
MQKTEAFRANECVKESRIQVHVKGDIPRGVVKHLMNTRIKGGRVPDTALVQAWLIILSGGGLTCPLRFSEQ